MKSLQSALNAAFLLLLGVSQAQAQVSFQKVVDSTMNAPGQGAFSDFSTAPSLDGSKLSFWGNYTTGEGIYTATVGTTGATKLADSSGSLLSFGASPSVRGSTVAFSGDTSSGSGIYTGTLGSTTLHLVGDSATAVPGQSGKSFTQFFDPTVDGTDLVFRGRFSSGEGVYAASTTGSVSSSIADTSMNAPGQSNNFQAFGSFPAVSGSNVAFQGYYGSGFGVYTGALGTSSLSLIADSSTAVPGHPTETFTHVNDPALHGSALAFQADYGSGFGIYAGTVGSSVLTTVADTSTPVPGQTGINFFRFAYTPSVSGSGVVFSGDYLTAGSTRQTGLFLQKEGTTIPILSTQDSLFGSQVTSLNVGATSYDAASNQLAFQYTLLNGTMGIGIARLGGTVVPEPTSAVFLLLGGIGALARRRRSVATSYSVPV